MKKALIVGINNYPFMPLAGCVNDAVALASVLSSHATGLPNFSVRLLTSPGERVDRASLREAIERLFEGDSDVTLLYFSGHGFIKSTGGYIVATDFQRYDEGVSMDEILLLANQSKAREKIILLDCCHSGKFGSPNIVGTGSILGDGVTVLTAARAEEAAIESGGSGLFTSLVIDALKGGAADLLGEVTPGGVYAYVDRALGPWEQRPVFKTNISRFTSLRTVQPPISRKQLRRLTELFPNPADNLALDPSFEPTSANPDARNTNTFATLQAYRAVNLLVPVGEEHMYFAAMNRKSCRLTAMGLQYWRLIKERKI
jgi:hypothetical protein